MKKLLLLLTLIISFQGFSQKGNIDSLIVNYVDYYKMAPETVFIHLNKSQFFNGENLWFKAYLYDTKTQLPYIKTTNLYATVFDNRGNLMEQKLFHVENAVADGHFEIKQNYPAGTYIIKFSTNWMKNFNEDLSAKLAFTVLGATSEILKNTEDRANMDIQFFPEGGHFVAGVMNTIGFKMNDDNGKAVMISSGKITNSKGTLVTDFHSNSLGMGKLNIIAEANERYQVEATLQNGKIVKQAFLTPELKGVAVALNTLDAKQIFVAIKTNILTLPSLLDKDFYLLIHRDGSVKKIDFRFKKDVYEYIMPIKKETLFSGMNILTFFNDQNQPIFERMLFNKTDDLIEDVKLTSVIKKPDSTSITFTTNNRFKNAISVSALPTQNVTYDNSNNILNSFLLKPYVKGSIENSDYYFSEDNRQTAYDLDILLLVQGWSKLNWNDIFYRPQIPLNNFETGFQVVGKVTANGKEKIEDVLLLSNKDGLMEKKAIDRDGYFQFTELHLSDSTLISLSAKDAKGNMVKPKLYYNVFPKIYNDTIDINEIKQYRKIDRFLNLADNDSYDLKNFVTDKTVNLDTISLESKKPKKKVEFINGLVGGNYIDLENSYNKFSLVADVIRNNGFDVSESFNNGVIIKSRRSVSISSGNSQPVVYINNVEQFDLDALRTLTLRDVKDLYISKSPSLSGSGNGQGGTINIMLNSSLYSNNSSETKFNNSIINLGFEKAKEYYSPNYDISKTEEFAKFGVINWIPNVATNNRGEFTIKIPSYGSDEVTLYINGMSEDGHLISKKEIVNSNIIEE